jgi:hypothetical protein
MLWVNNFTYASTEAGFVYVAFVVDNLPTTSSASGSEYVSIHYTDA